jgi:hypothetical protein
MVGWWCIFPDKKSLRGLQTQAGSGGSSRGLAIRLRRLRPDDADAGGGFDL